MVLNANSTVVTTNRRVTILNDPYINPLNSLLWTTGQDNRGFQYQIALDVLPAGVTSDMIKQGQTWFIENTTTAYRLSRYVGQISVSTINGVTISGVPTSTGQILTSTSISGAIWSSSVSVSGLPGPTISGYILALSGTTPTWTAQYPVGISGQVLTLSGTVPTPVWQTPSAGAGIPAGTVIDFAGPSANVPTGYLICDGASYSTTTYATLFAAIAYTWGGSSASFNVPDLRGKVTIGVSGTAYPLAALGGEFMHTLQSGETPLNVHTHTFTVPSSTGTTSTGTSSSVSLSIPGSTYSTGTGTTGSTTTVAGSASISSGTTGTGYASISASTSVSASQSAHSHGSADGSATGFWGTGSGSFGIAAGGNANARNTALGTNSQTPSISASATTTASDSGHTHSLSGVSVSIPSLSVNGASVPALSIPAMTVGGSVAIPGLNFTVNAQTGLNTSNNTAIISVSGHNNMQPYAVVYKIIKT